MSKSPDFKKAVDIRAYFGEKIGACGCSELGLMVEEVKKILSWSAQDIMGRQNYSSLYPERDGIFYLLAGLIDGLNMIEHGASIRCCWLTNFGKQFLDGLNSFTAEQIEEAEGEAYNGCWYDKYE
jgi:hypothetical protein